MSWVKNREEFKQAALSTAKAVSKNSDLESTSQASSRPPSSLQISLQYPPRSSSQVDAWRGEADFQAFWQAFHKEHASLKMPKIARDFFTELELCRVEMIGGEKFPGAKINLNAYLNTQAKKGIDNKVPPFNPLAANLWLKELNGESLAEDSKNTVNAFLSSIPININKVGKELIEAQNSQEDFQSIALDLMKDLDLMHEPATQGDQESFEDQPSQENAQDSESQQPQTEEDVEEQTIESQAEGTADEESEMLEEVQASIDSMSIDEEIDLTRNYNEDLDQTNYEDYKIFTSQFDEVVNAIELATPEESQRLRLQLDQLIAPHQTTIGKLANRLQRLLQAQQNRSWNYNLEEGLLDTAQLHRVITRPGDPLSFKQESESKFKDTVVSLLIDSSGSMRGRSMTLAAICGDIIGSTLERCYVKTELLGFTTKHWKGGESRKAWVNQGSPSSPGRLNDLRHIIFKSAEDNFRKARKSFGIMLREGLLKENVDGEALAWAHQRLSKRNEERKILIVISDGAPVDDSTLSTNHSNFLDNHLRQIIHTIETQSNVELLAIGIGHDVTKYYDKSITINRAEELAEALLDKLTELFND
ncbi:cobalt chelatase [Gammaproteobacteria bacterium]|nr:cobalt chelatase [Gammaproteobacteria bacterium]|tara:strand:- start:3467 stop:5236 length:1770 start_codon:yes stop_codon:yes gene_type:complete